MKAASLHDLKKEIEAQSAEGLLELCLRLAKYKKDNKELLSYLLFYAGDEACFITGVKEEIDMQFNELNTSSLYLAKKTIRKVLRTTKKFIKYSSQKTTEVELLVYFCYKLKSTGISLQPSTVLGNMYQQQLVNIQKAISVLHEDLQYDYQQELCKFNLFD